VELNTERRAKEMEEFDAMMKAKQAKLEELRRPRDEKHKRRVGGGKASEGICSQGKPNPTLQANPYKPL
jgi:hypothetical protein